MHRRIVTPLSAAHAAVLCAAGLFASGAAAATLAQQSSQASGVAISVKPVDSAGN